MVWYSIFPCQPGESSAGIQRDAELSRGRMGAFLFFSCLTRPTGRRRIVSKISENSRSKLPGSLDGNDGFSPTVRGSRLLERASADSAAAIIRGNRSRWEN